MSDQNLPNYGEKFQHFANITLGGLSGILISTPLAIMSNDTTKGAISLIIGLIFGLTIGYRRKSSRGFMYLCFIVILVLVGILSSR